MIVRLFTELQIQLHPCQSYTIKHILSTFYG